MKPASVEQRLRRVRVQMTAIFLAAFILGIGALSALAVALDAESRNDTIDATLRTATTTGAKLIAIPENGTAVYQFMTAVDTRPPGTELFAVDRNPPLFFEELPANDFYVISPDSEIGNQNKQVIAVGQAAAESGRETTRTIDGRRYLATPYGSEQLRGAVVGVTSTASAVNEHRSFWQKIALFDIALVTAAAFAANAFGRRSMRASLITLDAQERFLANASHDLRNPVAAIRAAAESARMRDIEPLAAITEIEQSGVRASEIIESMLTLSRLDSGVELRLEPVRLDLLIEQILDVHHLPSVSVSTELQPVVISGNAKLITQAVVNLLNNAIAHSTSSSVHIRVHDRSVAVRDDGPGIDPTLITQLFDRFTASGSSRGHGLGLSIVKAVAEAHGGTAHAENLPAGGCEFRITFPPATSHLA
jgi:two-component system OmpR family sensor kinase